MKFKSVLIQFILNCTSLISVISSLFLHNTAKSAVLICLLKYLLRRTWQIFNVDWHLIETDFVFSAWWKLPNFRQKKLDHFEQLVRFDLVLDTYCIKQAILFYFDCGEGLSNRNLFEFTHLKLSEIIVKYDFYGNPNTLYVHPLLYLFWAQNQSLIILELQSKFLMK